MVAMNKVIKVGLATFIRYLYFDRQGELYPLNKCKTQRKISAETWTLIKPLYKLYAFVVHNDLPWGKQKEKGKKKKNHS